MSTCEMAAVERKKHEKTSDLPKHAKDPAGWKERKQNMY